MHFYSAAPATGWTSSLVPDPRKLPHELRDRFYPDNSLFEEFVEAVEGADYVDMDYDAATQTVVVTFHSTKFFLEPGSWMETISLPSSESTVEIGVLSHELNSDPEDIQFGGFLTVLGRDDTPSKSTYLTNIAIWD
jgi:hypothetical protein